MDKWLFLALGSYSLKRRLKQKYNFNIIDSHFAYPEGFAATKIAKWFLVPVTINLRGAEVPQLRENPKLSFFKKSFVSATKLFPVSNSLKLHAIILSAEKDKITVVDNGVDIDKFYLLQKQKNAISLD